MKFGRHGIINVGFAIGLCTLACDDGSSDDEPLESLEPRSALTQNVRVLAAQNGIDALDPAPAVRPELVALGRALMFDKELSGNRDISCMTCHFPSLGTSDGRSLSIGQGASGLGGGRVHGQAAFIARNAPSLFNLHAMDALFWDGRVSVDDAGNFATPADAQLTPAMTDVFEFGAVSALGLFPVHSRIEMRGDAGNELAAIPDTDFTGIWSAVMDRLGAVPAYVQMFEAAYPGTDFDDMTFAHASNAMAGFMVDRFEATETPWDKFLRGNDAAMTTEQLQGAELFLIARCKNCHAGDALTDEQFHNVALAQFGPGAGNGPTLRDDWGRWNVDPTPANKYAFRSTPLRNVELTAPYGHAGQFVGLFDFLDHYSESHLKLQNYDGLQIEHLLRSTKLDNEADILATRDPLLEGVVFGPDVFTKLTAFMKALTDPGSRDLLDEVPTSVPSGLPVDNLPLGLDPKDVTYNVPTIVAMINPVKNTANQWPVTAPGSARAGLTISSDVAAAGTFVTGDEAVVVLDPLTSGSRKVNVVGAGINGFVKHSVGGGKLVELAISAKPGAVKTMASVVYGTQSGTHVVVVNPGVPSSDVEELLSESNQLIIFSGGVYHGDLVVTGSDNTIWGADDHGGRVIFTGDLVFEGSKNRVRGVNVIGNLTVYGSDLAVSFSRIEGDLDVDGGKNTLLGNVVCGSFFYNGSDLIALGNQGLPPLSAPDCP